MRLDHLAICASDLETGVAWAEARFGVAMGSGGKHARFGTHNRLLGLGEGLYLEVIAPDPAARIEGPRWFGLDRFEGPPCLGNWICRVPDMAAALNALPECGPAVPLERDGLRWLIGVPDNGDLPLAGALPTLIEWQVETTPGDALPESGVRLLGLEVVHPEAEKLARRVSVDRVTYRAGRSPRLAARFATPLGEVVL